MEFVNAELTMNELQPDSATARSHYESVYRQTGQKPPQLEEADSCPCPEELLYLWQHFDSMSIRRTFDDFGPEAISHEGVASWAALRGLSLMAWEVDVLDRIEFAVLSYHRAKARERMTKK